MGAVRASRPIGRSLRLPIAALLVAATTLPAGCGLGEGERRGTAELLVTRDFGSVRLDQERRLSVGEGETAMKLLRKSSDVKTKYGGRFVDAIDGVRSGYRGSRRIRRDWFFYVNGIESSVGAAEARVHPGDRVWWDYHDWSGAMRVPAVVGSFSRPLNGTTEGGHNTVRVDCARGAGSSCDEVKQRLARAGASPRRARLGAGASKGVIRVVVGVWEEVKVDRVARRLGSGPGKSGVFARFRGRSRLELLSARGKVVRNVQSGGGLVAATRVGDARPVWVVAGADETGLERAVGIFRAGSLRYRFAVAATGRGEAALPVTGKEVRG